MMTAAFTVGTHAKAYPNNCLASRSGEHLYSIKLTTDTDNGNLIAVGDWDSMDCFKEAAVSSFGGKIVEKMVDGTVISD